MIPKKLICFDLDGTLLDDQKRVAPHNRRLVQELVAQGHVVAIATGRLYKSARKVRRFFPAEVEIICSNGAVVENAGTIIRKDQIPVEQLAVLYELTKAYDLSLAFVSLYAAYHTKMGWTLLMNYFSNVVNQGPETIRNIHVRTEEEFLRYAAYYINGIVISRSRPEAIAALRKDLEALHCFNIESSGEDNVEIIPKGSNKGVAAQMLAAYHGISLENIIAFGDGENDAKLLRMAGLGIAMGNAPLKVQEAADRIIGDNNSDAIARTLQELLDLDPAILASPPSFE
ncbi:hypothetical protein ABB02_00963 [Clostridiaceae bacterium JG1575]|nr:hypothetical protein ABB02_00963 [Clostridiaceae bacterium JG1575]